MKAIKYLALSAVSVAVLALLSGCGKKYETVSGDPLKTKIYTLDNGLRLYMSVNRETPRIQTYIAVKVGSKNDPSETTGLAHYFEHLMFKGTESFGTTDYAAEKPMLDEIEALFERYRATDDEDERAAIYHRIDSVSYEASKLAIPNEYDKLMAIIGAEGTNAWTSNDETVYTEDIPSNQIDNWARIQADRFRHGVIRGFHTELETIYEEKNMSLTSDSDRMWDAVFAALFPNHPYGQQTTLGSQEHLKNPSITNVKEYHDTYYVPNNIAICVSGDFDPDEMVEAVEKYFGDWEPNPSIPELEYEKEQPIETPVVKEVYGLESEFVTLAWPLPAASDLKTAAVSDIASYILQNGYCGLIDLDVTQQQKVLAMSAGTVPMADYGAMLVIGYPKEGQSLDEVRDISLGEIARLRSGDFDESLISATVNNLKLNQMRALESNAARAQSYVTAFINGIPWKDAAREMDMLAEVTKEDVVAFAQKYLGENSYAIVYKRQGEDRTVQKIAAPEITPIVSNRDIQSDFLTEIQNTEVTPIEPVFVDFSRDMSRFSLADGPEVLYKHNELNDLFTLQLRFNYGTLDDPELSVAASYLSYLGTQDMSAEELASRMYALGCSYSFGSGSTMSYLTLSGLGENMGEALALVEDLIFNAVPDEGILEGIKSDVLKSREDSKKSQSSCLSALSRYVFYGKDYVGRNTLSNDEIMALSSERLLTKFRDLFSLGHEVLYYGPMEEKALEKTLSDNHRYTRGAGPLPEKFIEWQQTPSDRVVMAQYDANQIYYIQYSCDGRVFDPSITSVERLYNEYFGGGMNSIVFQEMREARGLAYSADAFFDEPLHEGGAYSYTAIIATQNDKMRQAVEAFDSIINDMPRSEAAFQVAKDALVGRLRTARTTGIGVLDSYLACRRMGLSEPLTKQVYETVQGLTLDDIVKFQQEWVKGRDYCYAVLGDIDDLDTRFLSTLGPVEVLSLEDIFGY